MKTGSYLNLLHERGIYSRGRPNPCWTAPERSCPTGRYAASPGLVKPSLSAVRYERLCAVSRIEKAGTQEREPVSRLSRLCLT